MNEQRKTWTSEEALDNLESLTRLEWSVDLPEGVNELLATYEAAIPHLTAEIRRLRAGQREERTGASESEPSGEEGSGNGEEDLAEFVRRLGLEHR